MQLHPPVSRLSVRQRLTLAVALLTTLVLAVVGATLYVLESRRIDRQIDTDLARQISQFRALQAKDPVTSEPIRSAHLLLQTFLERNLPDRNEQFYGFPSTGSPIVQGKSDMLLQGSAAFRALVADLESSGGTRTLHVGRHEYRVAVQPITEGSATSAFVVTHDVGASRHDLRELMLTYTLLAALSVILVAGLASWIAGRLLSPVRRLRDTARAITDDDLSRRLEVTGHDDLSDLQRTFNEMLDRLESASVTQRQLLDDAGHELRTPLTVLRGQLEVLDPADADDVAATRVLLLDEIDRMSRLVGDLLMLAKARRPDFVDPHPTEVETLTHGLLDRARALEDRNWLLDGVARGSSMLDAQRITQAVLQLADNAARHTGAGDEIGIGSRHHQGMLEFWVRDTGAGVDPTLRADIFERFTRAEHNDQGFGLGLSIVRAIAEAHDGEVLLDDTDSGATFRLRIPTRVLA
ncbi:MAG: two-component system, OmpR family, sensor kinase [Nocardioidaceae bacterium]|jgi:signal transduction histidine kinase|nr:two-component system, OmpR family, sensor kinase [Nocardioidaceae bacterium]